MYFDLVSIQKGGFMTRNQILYQQNVETSIHNRETERQGRDVIAETAKHNRATEAVGYGQLAEAGRHNQALEALEGQKVSLSERSLEETQRANRANEDIKRESNVITRYGIDTNASTSRYSADKQAASHMYGADVGYAGSKYSADARSKDVATQVASQQQIAEDNRVAQKVIEDNKNFVNQVVATMDNEARIKINDSSNRSKETIAQLDRISRESEGAKNRRAELLGMTLHEFNTLLKTVLENYQTLGGAFG